MTWPALPYQELAPHHGGVLGPVVLYRTDQSTDGHTTCVYGLVTRRRIRAAADVTRSESFLLLVALAACTTALLLRDDLSDWMFAALMLGGGSGSALLSWIVASSGEAILGREARKHPIVTGTKPPADGPLPLTVTEQVLHDAAESLDGKDVTQIRDDLVVLAGVVARIQAARSELAGNPAAPSKVMDMVQTIQSDVSGELERVRAFADVNVTATTQARVDRAIAALTGEDPTATPNASLMRIPLQAGPPMIPNGPAEP